MKHFLIGILLGAALSLAYEKAHAEHGGEHNPYDVMTIAQALSITDNPQRFFNTCLMQLAVEANDDDVDFDVGEQFEYCFSHLNLASQAATRLIISRAISVGNDQCLYREMI